MRGNLAPNPTTPTYAQRRRLATWKQFDKQSRRVRTRRWATVTYLQLGTGHHRVWQASVRLRFLISKFQLPVCYPHTIPMSGKGSGLCRGPSLKNVKTVRSCKIQMQINKLHNFPLHTSLAFLVSYNEWLTHYCANNSDDTMHRCTRCTHSRCRFPFRAHQVTFTSPNTTMTTVTLEASVSVLDSLLDYTERFRGASSASLSFLYPKCEYEEQTFVCDSRIQTSIIQEASSYVSINMAAMARAAGVL